MIKDSIHGIPVSVPESWEELTPRQALATFIILQGFPKKSKAVIQMLLLQYYIGYRPTKKCRTLETLETATDNLRRIARKVEFPFDTAADGTIILNNVMLRNPVPYLRLRFKKYYGAKFDITSVTRTDINAITFVECMDLCRAYVKSNDEEYLTMLVALLYPDGRTYEDIVRTNYADRFKNVALEVKELIYFWFTGVVRWIMEDDLYGLLFRGSKKQEDSISRGMSETISALSAAGYGDILAIRRLGATDFFDLQIDSYKASIQRYVANGGKPEELSKNLHIPPSIIQKLC